MGALIALRQNNCRAQRFTPLFRYISKKNPLVYWFCIPVDSKDRSVPFHIELVGSLAAVITTVCWIPQIIKIVRHRQTASISLISNVTLMLGVFLWLLYGLMIGSWPVIAANGVTFLLILAILGLKLRYG